MHINLAMTKRDLMSSIGLNLIIQIKFVIKLKQCKEKKHTQKQPAKPPQMSKIMSNERLPPEILHQNLSEWSLNCSSKQFLNTADVWVLAFVSFTLLLVYSISTTQAE